MLPRPALRLVLAALLILTASLGPASALAKQAPAACAHVSAKVFNANPVATSGDNSLRDRKDADYPALNAERVTVELTGLDGSGYLRGTYAIVVSETGDPAFETDCTYHYTRHDD